MTARRNPEGQLQRQVVSYLRLILPDPWLVLHVPNGGGRSKAEAGIFKALGVLAGFPDLLIIGPQFVGAIELKAPPAQLKTGGVSTVAPRLSDAQASVIERLGACGVPTLICRSLHDVTTGLTGLGVPLHGRSP